MFQQEVLIDLLKNNSERSMPLLYDKYSEALYGIILRIVKDEQESQDILQDTFVKIWQNRNKYDAGKGRLFTWMMRSARNTSINFIQSKSNKVKSKIHPLDSNVYHIISSLKTNEETIDTCDMISKLDEKYKKIIDLVYFQGYTQKEISEKLNMPLGSVKSSVKIGLRELRKIYEGKSSILMVLVNSLFVINFVGNI